MPGPVVAIPVGPTRRDYGRAGDLLDALRAVEPRVGRILLVDDDLDPARRPWPTGVDVLRNPRRGRGDPGRGGRCAATMVALAHAHACAPGAWVLRLDADALPLRAFVDVVEAQWRPGDGVLGGIATDRHRIGDAGPTRAADGSSATAADRRAARAVRRHTHPVWVRRPRRGVAPVRPAVGAVRRLVAEARAHGYVPGERRATAACAVSPALVDGLAARRLLRRPGRWARVDLRDDELLGLAARACGLAVRDLPGGVLALGTERLPGTPADLLAARAVIVHPVRTDDQADEDGLRHAFAAARG